MAVTDNDRVIFTKEMKKDYTILLPNIQKQLPALCIKTYLPVIESTFPFCRVW